MDKTLYISIFLFYLFPPCTFAQGQRLSTYGFIEAGHNTTMQYYGGPGIIADFALTNYFTLTGGIYLPFYKEQIINNTISCNPAFIINGKVTFPLKREQTLFLENRYLFKSINAYQISELNAGILFGYESSRLLCSIGMAGRLITSFRYDPADGSRFVTEPFNLLYCLEGYLFKHNTRKWNLGLRFSNYRSFRINHSADPCYTLLGSYELSPRMQLLANAGVRPAGVFTLNAHYYESYINIGVNYQW